MSLAFPILRTGVAFPIAFALMTIWADLAHAQIYPDLDIDTSLCGDDGETHVPDFAIGRDEKGCLLVDPGNGDPVIPFQFTAAHKTGIDLTGSPESIDLNGDGCSSGPDKSCTLMIFDVTVDNYLSPRAKNEDGWFIGTWYPSILLIKNTKILNSWKCYGGEWNGPNGIFCAEGETSGSHVDGIQHRRNPDRGGWYIWQDSVLANNSSNQLARITDGPENGPIGNHMFQGFQFGNVNAIGEATTYIQDCYDRGQTDPGWCEHQRGQLPKSNETWLIDVWGSAKFRVRAGSLTKLMIINTGCGTTGCNGTIEYENGWPHPIQQGQDPGPGECPNGLVLQDPVNNSFPDAESVFCYTSIENALNDTVTAGSGQGDCPAPFCPHKEPPFIRYSRAGWENPPATATGGPRSGRLGTPAVPKVLQ